MEKTNKVGFHIHYPQHALPKNAEVVHLLARSMDAPMAFPFLFFY
jgi:hypothetical protein